jgi:uncharacterized protein YggU (UPF0235/DUF167 family)
VRVTIHVRPGSSRERVGGTHDGALVVRIREAPEGGRATEAALRALARAVGLPARSVTLVQGVTSRRKTVDIDAGDEPEAVRLLGALVDRLREGGAAGSAAG